MKTFLLSFFCCAPLWSLAQTVDSMALRQVDSLLQVAVNLKNSRDFDKALETVEAAEKIALSSEPGLGPESAAYGSCCNTYGYIFQDKNNYPEAEKWYLKALDIREKALGKLHPDYATTFSKLGTLYSMQGQYDKAEAWFIESINLRKKILGEDDPDYAESLRNLGILFFRTGKYDKAEALFVEALEIVGRAYGKENPAYARGVNGLAVVYKNMRQYEKAEALYLEALGIQEKTQGKDNVDYTTSLNNLALLYKALGQYEKAEFYLLEAKDIRVKVLGKNHPDYGQSMLNLGNLYNIMHQFEKAEFCYLETKRVWGEVLGTEHPHYAICVNNFASIYYALGQYEKAEPLYVEANDIWEKVAGKDLIAYAGNLINLARFYLHIEQEEKAEAYLLKAKNIFELELKNLQDASYIQCIRMLGLLYSHTRQYDKAELYSLQTKDIREKIDGKINADYAGELINLASLYGDLGQKEKAKAYLLEAKDIFEVKMKDFEDPFYINCLNNLGMYYFNKRQYEDAKPLLIQSFDIQEKTMGKGYADYSQSLYPIALVSWATNDYEKAAACLIERSNCDQTNLAKAINHLSAQEMSGYSNKVAADQNLAFSLTSMIASPKLASTCYDNALFYKGFLLNAASRLNTLAETSPKGRELHIQLKGYQRRLAAQYTLPIAQREGVAALEEKAGTVEKELARTVAGYAETAQQARWNEVREALKPNEAAVEFVRFAYHNPHPTDSVLYTALLLRRGFAAPQYIGLFEEKSLTALLLPGAENQADHTNTIYRDPALFELLWKPLEQALVGAKTVYFSPDGLLHRINIRAIQAPDGSILSDHYRLIRLNSTRQLVVPPVTQVKANDALVYGGIQYDMDAGAIQKISASLQPVNAGGTRGGLNFHNSDSTQRLSYRGIDENGGTWKYLPFTEVEVELLQHDLRDAGTSVRLLNGYAASEESFKSLGHPSPRILHLATHGFFFPDPAAPVEGSHWPLDGKEPSLKISEHPMIRSGLILAGGNHAWKAGTPFKEGMEDGILTAYEISQMDLSNTELAVLSACETGLGDISGSEGVYGLQRAFKIAGTRYLLMSLWKIPDLETQELMTTFYRHWLKDKMPVPDAYQATQQEMREKFKDPYLWAGFVLVE